MTAWTRLAVMVLALLLLALPPGRQALPADAPVTFDLVNAAWTVAADGSAVVEAEVTLRLPKTGTMRVAQVPLTWSGSTETLEVLEARVEKPNGRLVPAGKDAIREDPPTGDRYAKLKKVQAAIQGDQVRITSPSRDDLQAAMTLLRAQDFGVELKFGNYR